MEMTDAQVDAVQASWPTCPTCGSWPAIVQYTYHATHSLWFEIDGSPSLSEEERTIVLTEEYDVLDKKPVEVTRIVDGISVSLGYMVECSNQHEWSEPRIKPTGRGKWELLPPTVDTQIAMLDGLLGRGK